MKFFKWFGTLEAKHIILWDDGIVNGFQTLEDLKEFLQYLQANGEKITQHKIFSIGYGEIKEITEA